jgi:hypothetical protein
MIIILEDDDILNPCALQYFDWALESFSSSREIFQINGFSPLNTFFNRKKLRVYESLFAQCWGWATWKSRWDTFDVNLPNLAKTREIPAEFHSQFKFPRPFLELWNERLRRVLGGFDTWDFQWQLHIWQEGGFVIAPNRSLTENIGFDEVATHTRRPLQFISKSRIERITTKQKLLPVDGEIDVRKTDTFLFPTYHEFKIVIKLLRLKSLSFILQLAKKKIVNSTWSSSYQRNSN